MQKVFWDRTKVLKILEEAEIPTPAHIIIDECEEINNDGENNVNNELNTSEEKEKKVESYKKQINKLMKKENNLILDLKRNKSLSISIHSSRKSNKDIIRITKNIIENKKEKEKEPKTMKEYELIECDDYIEYKGKKLYKPFVEKPLNGDDHDIYIYYPPN